MNNPRLQQLFNFLKEDPDDSFTLYAIALEYEKTDEEKALEYYGRLLAEHEMYVPTYYHAAKLYAELEEFERAKEIYEKGIEMSKKMQDSHALKELEKAYQQFLLEEDF